MHGLPILCVAVAQWLADLVVHVAVAQWLADFVCSSGIVYIKSCMAAPIKNLIKIQLINSFQNLLYL
jgi:hypothetical protein